MKPLYSSWVLSGPQTPVSEPLMKTQRSAVSPLFQEALWTCPVFVSLRQCYSVIPGYRNKRPPRWSGNSIIGPTSPTEATNPQWHPYIQCTDVQALKHTHCCALNTCSQWNTHRRQSDCIRETRRVSSWPHKYTVRASGVDISIVSADLQKIIKEYLTGIKIQLFQWILHI